MSWTTINILLPTVFLFIKLNEDFHVVNSFSPIRSRHSYSHSLHHKDVISSIVAWRRKRVRVLSKPSIDFELHSKKIIDDGDDFDDDDFDDDDFDDDIQSLWQLGDADDAADDDKEENDYDVDSNDKSNVDKTITIELQKESQKGTQLKKNKKVKSNQNETFATVKNLSDDEVKVDNPSPRGVGRQGYNLTLLYHIDYDQLIYNEEYKKVSFDIRIELLQDYYNDHGDINVPFRYKVPVNDYDKHGNENGTYDIHLGRWLHWIRTLYQKDQELDIINKKGKSKKRRKIPLEYVDKLDKFGMNWEGVGARRRPASFQNKLNQLEKYIKKYNNSYVPKDWPENKSLAMWVERQRFLYKRKSEGREIGDQLTDERIQMLLQIGFDFTGSNTSPQIEDANADYDKIWWEMLELLQRYKNKNGDCNIKIDNDNQGISQMELTQLHYWTLEQKRQYSILQGSTFEIAGASVSFKCLFTPQRFQALNDLGFDFSMYHDSHELPPLPWVDIAQYSFDCEKMLDLLYEHKLGTGSCSIQLNRHTHLTVKTRKTDNEDWHNNNNEQNETRILLYLFQQRLRWEKRHEAMKPNFPEINWILEKDDLDIEQILNQMGFAWFDHELPDRDNTLQREYEWWAYYYDLCLFKKANGDFTLDQYGTSWYSEELVDWLEEQNENYSYMLKESQESNGNSASANKSATYSNEWHFQALLDIGYDFSAQSNSLGSHISDRMKPVGRPPAILLLENDFEHRRYDDLSDDLQNIINTSRNRKRIDQAEQLAWLVRYEALRRLYLSHGPGSLSTLSADNDVCDQRLALWASNQRKQYSNYVNGKKSALTPGRIKLLDDIKFDWEVPNPDDEWIVMKAALLNFKSKYGTCYVPAAYSANVQLGQWVHVQRQLYQLSQKRNDFLDVTLATTLSKERAIELIDIGLDLTIDNFSFGSIAYETIWKCRLEELEDFKEKHGFCHVTLDYNSPYYDLALWSNEQRILYQRVNEGISSQLDESKIKDLENLGFSWIEETSETT